MKLFFLALLLVAYSQARITIPLEKVRIDDPESAGLGDASVVSTSARFLAQSDDSLKVNFWNQRNFFYFGNVFVGSQNKTMKVLFDTGSNDLWLSAPSCYACPGTTRFSCAESTTCSRSNSQSKSLAYGLGKVDGYTVTDNIGLTPTFRTKAPIMLATSGSDLTNYNLVDGFLGLGSKNNAEDFIDQAFKDGLIDEKIFSIFLDFNGDKTKTKLTYGSYLTLGYVPEDKINNMAWIPVTDSDRWAANIHGMKVGDKVLSSVATSGAVLFDTGCSANHFSAEIRKEFDAQMAKFDYKTYYSIKWWRCYKEDMPKYPNISLSVNGLRIDVTSYSYFDFPTQQTFDGHPYCQVLMSDSLYGLNILGDAFLQENFIAYSKRNQTIGVNLAVGHQVLPSPNPPMVVILVQLALMLLVGAGLFMADKKRKLTKTALADEDTVGGTVIGGTATTSPYSQQQIY